MISKEKIRSGDAVKFKVKGKFVDATVLRVNQKTATVDASNGHGYRVPYVMLYPADERVKPIEHRPDPKVATSSKKKGLSPDEVKKGDKVKFWDRGKEITAVVTRVNQKTVSIAFGTWKGRVSFRSISKADENETVSENRNKKKERQWSAAQTRDYELSQKLVIEPLPESLVKKIRVKVMKLDLAFTRKSQDEIHDVTNEIATLLCNHYNIPEVKVWTKGKKIVGNRGTTNGVHRTRGMGTSDMRASISVFSRDKNGVDLVKPEKFLETLVHEWVHHWDRFAHEITHEYHTKGFYARIKTIHDEIKLS